MSEESEVMTPLVVPPSKVLAYAMLQALQEVTAQLIKAAIEAKHPTLKEQVFVTCDPMSDFFFRARETDGGKVRLLFGIGPNHPRFNEMVLEAGRASDQIRFNTTSAVEMRKK